MFSEDELVDMINWMGEAQRNPLIASKTFFQAYTSDNKKAEI